jgi:hypothetical protein
VKARGRILLAVAVVGLIGAMLYLMATPGSVLTERYANGELTSREYAGGLVGLLVLGFAALGLDWRDWF